MKIGLNPSESDNKCYAVGLISCPITWRKGMEE